MCLPNGPPSAFAFASQNGRFRQVVSQLRPAFGHPQLAVILVHHVGLLFQLPHRLLPHEIRLLVPPLPLVLLGLVALLELSGGGRLRALLVSGSGWMRLLEGQKTGVEGKADSTSV